MANFIPGHRLRLTVQLAATARRPGKMSQSWSRSSTVRDNHTLKTSPWPHSPAPPAGTVCPAWLVAPRNPFLPGIKLSTDTHTTLYACLPFQYKPVLRVYALPSAWGSVQTNCFAESSADPKVVPRWMSQNITALLRWMFSLGSSPKHHFHPIPVHSEDIVILHYYMN